MAHQAYQIYSPFAPLKNNGHLRLSTMPPSLKIPGWVLNSPWKWLNIPGRWVDRVLGPIGDHRDLDAAFSRLKDQQTSGMNLDDLHGCTREDHVRCRVNQQRMRWRFSTNNFLGWMIDDDWTLWEQLWLQHCNWSRGVSGLSAEMPRSCTVDTLSRQIPRYPKFTEKK